MSIEASTHYSSFTTSLTIIACTDNVNARRLSSPSFIKSPGEEWSLHKPVRSSAVDRVTLITAGPYAIKKLERRPYGILLMTSQHDTTRQKAIGD